MCNQKDNLNHETSLSSAQPVIKSGGMDSGFEEKFPNEDEKPSNKLESLDNTYDNEPEAKPDRMTDEMDDLRYMINWEHEEKARNRIESGDLARFYLATGNGQYSSIMRCVMGNDEQAYINAINYLCLADEKLFPEIYLSKRMPKRKLGICQRAHNGCDMKESTHITKEQFIELYSAVCFANGHGVALNVHVTIQWGLMGFLDHSEATKVLQDEFIKHLNSWYKFNQNKFDVHIPPPLFWIYTHECPKKELFHTHFLVGIPIEMRGAFKKWAKDRISAIWKKKCVSEEKTKPMPEGILHITHKPSSPITRQWYLFHYLCKGLDPIATVEIPGYSQPVPISNLIQSSYCNPGHISCKSQIGLSNNLRRTIRKEHGFQSKMEQGIFDKRELYTSFLYDNWHKQNIDPRHLDLLYIFGN